LGINPQRHVVREVLSFPMSHDRSVGLPEAFQQPLSRHQVGRSRRERLPRRPCREQRACRERLPRRPRRGRPTGGRPTTQELPGRHES
jgi:hypothetical protein